MLRARTTRWRPTSLGPALHAARVDADEQLGALPVMRIGPLQGLVEPLIQQAIRRGCGHDPEAPTRGHAGGAITAQGAQLPVARQMGEQAQMR